MYRACRFRLALLKDEAADAIVSGLAPWPTEIKRQQQSVARMGIALGMIFVYLRKVDVQCCPLEFAGTWTPPTFGHYLPQGRYAKKRPFECYARSLQTKTRWVGMSCPRQTPDVTTDLPWPALRSKLTIRHCGRRLGLI